MGDKLTILTLAIGVDYRKSLAKALESKRSYAAKHDYNYIEGNEAWWDRTRPIAWSKVPFIIEQLSKLPEGALIWQSDADVLITNLDMRLEDNVLPLLPEGKDMLLMFDACRHLNSGNILMRNTAWCRDFWKRVNERTEFTYHIWWENMAMIQIIEENAADRAKVEISNQHKRFNAYIMGCDGEPLWQPGDFLVHFAGVYDSAKMSRLIDEIESGKVPRLDMYKP
jgi:hypothetical protein